MSGFTTSRVLVPVIMVLLGTAMTSFFVADKRTSGPRLREEKAVRTDSMASDTLDIPTVQEARQMIIGTWIENTADKIGNFERGSKKWVFTDGGTVRKYRDGELFAEQSYEIVKRYSPEQDPDEIVGYLKFTRSSGEIYYATLDNIHRGDDASLLVQHHGTGVSATIFKPPSAFK